MRTSSIIFFLLLALQVAYGQACGIYRIKYIATIQSDSGKMLEVMLPSIPFLHGYEKEKSPFAFVTAHITDGYVEIEIRSHLTSELFDEATTYLDIYKGASDALLLKLITRNAGRERVRVVSIPWDQIEMRKIEDGNFGNLFEMNLRTIKVD